MLKLSSFSTNAEVLVIFGSKQQNNLVHGLLGMAGMILFMVWVTFMLVVVFGKPASAAEFGDMFGAVNALFSGFAFLGVLVTVLLQGEQLRLQQEEIKLTREELRRAASAQEETVELLRREQIANNSAKILVIFADPQWRPQDSWNIRVCLRNAGADAFNLTVEISGDKVSTVNEKISLLQSTSDRCCWTTHYVKSNSQTIEVKVTYSDKLSSNQTITERHQLAYPSRRASKGKDYFPDM